MRYNDKKVHGFGKWHGGKNRYARQYIKEIKKDNFTKLSEPFSGPAGVLMNVVRGEFAKEYLNDADPRVSRCLTTLRDRGPEVKQYINRFNSKYCEEVFEKAAELIGHPNDVVHAANYITRNRMSSGGRFDRFAVSDRQRGGKMGDQNAWDNYRTTYIDGTIERLRDVVITNDDGIKVITRLAGTGRKSSRTLFFLDPPYMQESLVSKNNYLVTVDDDYHKELLDTILRYPNSRYYLCGYDTELYAKRLGDAGWSYSLFDRPADSGRTETKSRRLEVLWKSPGA